MAVDRTGRGDQAARRNDPRRWCRVHVDAVLHVGVAGVADADDLSVLDPDVALTRPSTGSSTNAPVMQTSSEDSRSPDGCASHAVADVTPRADQALFADGDEIALAPDEEVRVAEAHQIALGRAVQVAA